MQSFDSSESQKGRRGSNSFSRSKFTAKNKEVIREENYRRDSESAKSGSRFLLPKKEDKNSVNNTSTNREERNILQNKFFDMIDFDKLGLLLIDISSKGNCQNTK